jgi:hypothetical protein
MFTQGNSIIKDLTENSFHFPSVFQGNTASAFQLAVNQVGDDALVQIIFSCPRIESFTHVEKYIGDNLLPLFYVHGVTLIKKINYELSRKY